MAINIDSLLDECRALHGDIDVRLHFGYSVSYFSKRNFRENDIFAVHTNIQGAKKRIGWIFPVFVLGSSEYNLFRDRHFTEYVKIGASHLSSLPPQVSLDENSHALILKDEVLLQGDSLIQNFTISLLKWGYYPVSSDIGVANSLCEIDNSSVEKIPLVRCRDIEEYAPYIRKLLQEFLPKVDDPLSRFVSIYQTVELLMERFFNHKIDSYRSRRTTIGTIRESISELSNERKLINCVFGQCAFRQELNPFEEGLIRRLFGADKDETYYEQLTLPNFIYDLRNAIVHNYHKYELSSLMREIAERMELIWVELLENAQISDFLLRKDDV